MGVLRDENATQARNEGIVKTQFTQFPKSLAKHTIIFSKIKHALEESLLRTRHTPHQDTIQE